MGCKLATLLPLFAGCPHGVPAAGWLPYCYYLQDAHVVCRQAGWLPYSHYLQDVHVVCQQAGYPFATIRRMPTWCDGRLATLLPLFVGCPRGVPAGWLPHCHYLQDAHVVCRQAGYPIATICRMPTWCAGRLATPSALSRRSSTPSMGRPKTSIWMKWIVTVKWTH
jgi:hypothetical protein